jgi:hypothetical protein
MSGLHALYVAWLLLPRIRAPCITCQAPTRVRAARTTGQGPTQHVLGLHVPRAIIIWISYQIFSNNVPCDLNLFTLSAQSVRPLNEDVIFFQQFFSLLFSPKQCFESFCKNLDCSWFQWSGSMTFWCGSGSRFESRSCYFRH